MKKKIIKNKNNNNIESSENKVIKKKKKIPEKINNKKNKLIEEELSDSELIDDFNSGDEINIKPFFEDKKKSILNPKPLKKEESSSQAISHKEQIEVTEKINDSIMKKGRGRPKKEDGKIEKKKIKIKEEPDLTEEEKLLKLQLIEKYKKYRSSFTFKRNEIIPESLKLIELQNEIDQLQNELDGNGSLLAAQIFLLASFRILENVSHVLPIGLKLDGLSEAAAQNQSQFDKVLNELMIKYNLFSSSCEMRFAMLVAQTVFQVHSMNIRKEQQLEKMKNVDPAKLIELKEKYKEI